MLQRINNTIGRILAGDETSWDFGFLESVKEQVEKSSPCLRDKRNYWGD